MDIARGVVAGTATAAWLSASWSAWPNGTTGFFLTYVWSFPKTVRIRDAEIRIFNRSPESDVASEMYVLEVFGLSVLIRLRAGDPDDPDTGRNRFSH